MNTPQLGIIPPAQPFAYFLCLNIKDIETAKQLVKNVQQHSAKLAEQYSDSQLLSVIGIGSEAWTRLFAQEPPQGLTPFSAMHNEFTRAPSTHCDLLIHIRSQRHDVNFELALQLMQQYANGVECVDEVSGFRYLDSRDLSGFVDGTENPQTEPERKSVALDSNKGSFIHIQRYVHQLPRWQAIPIQQQEDTIGRSKADNIEYPSAKKPLYSHIKRASVKDSEGESIEVLRHSMPYGNSRENGLFFISYAHSAGNFTAMLDSMINGDSEGHKDHLLKYTQAVTGAAFYAPSMEFLEAQASYI